MKRSIVSVLSLGFLVGVCGVLYAHPPAAIDANMRRNMLQVYVRHDVDDPADHYIKKIEVYIDDEKIVDQRFNSQTAPDGAYAMYMLPEMITPESKIVIKAECNKGGDLEREFLAEELLGPMGHMRMRDPRERDMMREELPPPPADQK